MLHQQVKTNKEGKTMVHAAFKHELRRIFGFPAVHKQGKAYYVYFIPPKIEEKPETYTAGMTPEQIEETTALREGKSDLEDSLLNTTQRLCRAFGLCVRDSDIQNPFFRGGITPDGKMDIHFQMQAVEKPERIETFKHWKAEDFGVAPHYLYKDPDLRPDRMCLADRKDYTLWALNRIGNVDWFMNDSNPHDKCGEGITFTNKCSIKNPGGVWFKLAEIMDLNVRDETLYSIRNNQFLEIPFYVIDPDRIPNIVATDFQSYANCSP